MTSDVLDLSARLAASLAQRDPAPVPDVGIYPGTPMELYHRWDCASNSRLTRLRRSPAHLKAYLEQPPEDTAALALGRAAHAAILEPDDFQSRYVRAPKIDRRTKAGKEEWDGLENKYGAGFVMKWDDYDCAMAMRESVYAHPRAKSLLTGNGDIELSAVAKLAWSDDDSRFVSSEAGVLTKVRMDRHSPGIAGGAIVDIKSTRDASRHEFERAIFSLGYARQAAVYLDTAAALGIPAEHFVIVAVEKEAPYAVAVYRLTEGAIDAGREQLRPLFHTYAMCQALNEWPGYSGDVVDVALPSWAWGQIDDEVREAQRFESFDEKTERTERTP